MFGDACIGFGFLAWAFFPSKLLCYAYSKPKVGMKMKERYIVAFC